MNRKIVLSLTFVLVASLFSGIISCLADANVGVKVGLSYDYVSAASGTKRDSSGNLTLSLPFTASYLETITVQQISGTNVTIKYDRDFMNGTTSTGTSWIDLNTGYGTAYFVVIPAGLSTGSLIYPGWTDESGSTDNAPTVTNTVYLKDGDSTVEAVQLSFSYTVDDQECSDSYYWEKSTGLLLKYTRSGAEVTDDEITEALTLHFSRVGLEQVFYPLIDSEDYPVSVNSNSQLLGFEFKQDEKQLRLQVSGKTGTIGSCKVAVPESLLSGSFTLTIDDHALTAGNDYTQTGNGTHQIFDVSYVHSVHTIEITGTETIPEFSAVLLMSLFLVSSLIAVAVYRKRLVGSTA
ncbi:MAG: hypothetical protein QCH99_04475 [Candidatus Bathyarchaeota archaeon]|nr:hypothetical protein [Candidatus Bathyarchaeum tardum]